MSNILKDLIRKALKEAETVGRSKMGSGCPKKYQCKKDGDCATFNDSDCGNHECVGGCCTAMCDDAVRDRSMEPKVDRERIKEAEMTADNTSFKIKVDVSNKQSETKLGIRIQLEPKGGMLEPDVRDKLEATIMKKLNTSLGQYDIQVSKDTDVPREDILGFFIPLSQIKNMIIKSVKGPGDLGNMATAQGATPAPTPFKPDLEKDDLQRKAITQMMDKEKSSTNESMIEEMINEELIKEMRQRTLNEISQIVIREDFYGFVNAGNNMLRSLEEKGYDIRESKKYLKYLVAHNIM